MPPMKQVFWIALIAVAAVVAAQNVPVVRDYVSGNKRVVGSGDKAAA